ncbi:hypothetical protein CDV31_011472 [Fusarium ambrosium]|uniref:Protein kinase domain-containing protein n=1 Tax=Fusarium ambrosium TaxID=131363 RepID=A0A428TGL5_9HYPO|nr:hypothetical protein CDV31_011472 [Fusarium ambrosium]
MPASPTSAPVAMHPNPKDLRDQISYAMKVNIEGRDFVPADAIDSLASPDAVRGELSKKFDDSTVTDLVDYVRNKPAIKVFLILVWCRNIKSIANIRQSGFGDQHLPLDEQETTIQGETQTRLRSLSQTPGSGQVLEPLCQWGIADRREFLERQWAFMAPIFERAKFSYELHNRCPLPFIPLSNKDELKDGTRGGLSSSVKEIKVHDAHQQVLKQNQENGCFLFPWAESGNLKEFWKSETAVRPLQSPQMMTWMLHQMCGLCDALSVLHNENRRHGDIKPENILLFKEGDHHGTLRIADVGLAKFHSDATDQRRHREEITKTMTGTTRYLSPEFVQGGQIPRIFDIWSLGCVFIEFLIWTLHGHDRLGDFRKATSAYFWEEVEGKGTVIHSEVRAWISNMTEILQSSETALGGLLQLVESDMLVPEYEKRSASIEVHGSLLNIYDRAKRDENYLIDPNIEPRASTNPPRSKDPSQTLDVPKQTRQPAPLSKRQGSFQINVQGPDDEVNPSSSTAQTARAQEEVGSFLLEHYLVLRNIASFEFGGLVSDIKARSKGCRLCLLFSQAATELGLEDNTRFLSRRIESTILIPPNGPKILSVYSDPDQDTVSPGAQIGYPVLPKPGSPSQFAFIKEWLEVCQKTHNHGPLGDERPTRVLDLGSSDGPKIQLITGDAMDSNEYIALSHCWGKGVMFRTLTENVDSLGKAVDFRRLPRTFQDAIKTTRGLNVRYLWIDSLCIIQDDEEDWKREAARMQQVFSNASCVIAASSASSSAEGFLDPQREDRPFATLQSPSGSISYVCKFIDNFGPDTEEAPLNKRGWVLQERALARRSIHFTSTQVYLECGDGVQCESLMKLANNQAVFLSDSDFPNSILDYYKGGRIVLSQNLFKVYSTLKFTKSSDRPIAISGLEKRMMSAFKTRGGYGVFQAFFERSLLWQRPESGSLARITYPADRNVPSWSWMAYEGSITFVDAPFDKVDWTKDYESPFEVDMGRRYWEANGSNPAPVLKSKSARRFSSSGDPDEVFRGVRFDLDRAAFHHQLSALRCIVIGKDKPSESKDAALHYVLVIAPPPSGKPQAYVRVGVGILVKSLISWDLEEYVEVQ